MGKPNKYSVDIDALVKLSGVSHSLGEVQHKDMSSIYNSRAMQAGASPRFSCPFVLNVGMTVYKFVLYSQVDAKIVNRVYQLRNVFRWKVVNFRDPNFHVVAGGITAPLDPHVFVRFYPAIPNTP